MSFSASGPELDRSIAPRGTTQASTASVLIYALPMIPIGFMGGLVSMYLLKFSTDVLLIAPGVIGLLFGLSRMWDAISDPLAGYWSDRTRTRLGRRRPWLIASCAPLGLLFLALWSPPVSLTSSQLVVWMGAGIILFYTASTALGIPHLALGAELTQGYHDRSRVFGGRMLLEFAGILLAAGALMLLEPAADPRAVATGVGVGGATLVVALTLTSALIVREPPGNADRGPQHPYAAFRDVWRNSHARLLVVVFFLDQLSFTCLITVMPYTIQYILGEQGTTGILVGGAIGAALLFFPIWFPLSRRFGKRNPWIAATLIKSLAFGIIFLVQPGAFTLVLIAVVLIGGVQGAGGILGPSIKADVIDYDEMVTGERKEGAYFAVWALASKAAASIAVILVGFVLQFAHFEPNTEQTESTLLAIRMLSAGLPMLFGLVSMVLLLRFRLNAEEHAKIRAILDARDEGTATRAWR